MSDESQTGTKEDGKSTMGGDAEVRQVAGMTLAGRSGSNHWVIMDGKKNFGGAEGGASPMELVLLALGGCTSMDVISLLRKMRIQYSDFRVTMDVERAEEHPKVFTDIILHYHFTGKELPPAKLEKAVSLSQDKYCSVSAMLNKAVNISYQIHTYDE
jgi:putative redox protein